MKSAYFLNSIIRESISFSFSPEYKEFCIEILHTCKLTSPTFPFQFFGTLNMIFDFFQNKGLRGAREPFGCRRS